MTAEMCKKFDVSKNVLILCCLTLVLGFLLLLSLIICVALNAIEIQGVKELLGVLGGLLISPSAIMFLRKIFLKPEEKAKEDKES